MAALKSYEYYRDTSGVIYCGNSIDVLKCLPDESVQTCITSPPYWGLRDYSVDGQLGLEETPEEYVEKMVDIFREVKRVLKGNGTVWLNLGDSYSAGGRGNGQKGFCKQHTNKGSLGFSVKKPPPGLKPKDLVGIPWRVAFALQADGWYLRSDVIEEVEIYCPHCGWHLEERIWRHSQDREIIWKKPNPMTESAKDRPTKSHEHIFLLSKNAKYYYDADAIAEDGNYDENFYRRKLRASADYNLKEPYKNNFLVPNPDKFNGKRNKRSVWTVTTKPFKQAHFATFPPDLIKPCVLAGCPNGGTVLDPFMGAGTTALVAKELNRQYIGIELNAEYIDISKPRLAQEMLL